MHHGDVPSGKVVISRLLGQEEPDRCKRDMGILGFRISGGTKKGGSVLVQQRCQWSAAMAEVTSVLRLHDATNAYLSMKLDVAKQAANDMALKEVDKFFCRPAHLSSVRMAKSTFW